MKTFFIKTKNHRPNIYLLDASKQALGKLASKAVFYLKGKQSFYFSKSQNLNNFVIIINTEKIFFNKKKDKNLFYYKSSQAPGHLKALSFGFLKKEFPNIIFENAIKKMFKKNISSKQALSKLFIYKTNIVRYKKSISKRQLFFTHTNLFKLL